MRKNNGGVCILKESPKTRSGYRWVFYPSGLAKVKEGDLFYSIDPPGGEGSGPMMKAEKDPVKTERGWSIKATSLSFEDQAKIFLGEDFMLSPINSTEYPPF